MSTRVFEWISKAMDATVDLADKHALADAVESAPDASSPTKGWGETGVSGRPENCIADGPTGRTSGA